MCIDLNKFNHRVTLLQQGHTLYLDHLVYGKYMVYMNPQQNRILMDGICPNARRRTDYDHYTVSTTYKGELNGNMMDTQRGTSEEMIGHLLMWNCGGWYLEAPQKSVDGDEVDFIEV